MPTQVAFWRTADGTLHETLELAIEYENRQRVLAYLAGKATALAGPDIQDLLGLAWSYLLQPVSPVEITYRNT